MNAETEVLTMHRHVQTLKEFFDKFEAWEKFCCIHPIGNNSPPKVTYYEKDRAWCAATFGAKDWSAVETDCGWKNYSKTVDGVEITLYHAAKVEAPKVEPVPVELLAL